MVDDAIRGANLRRIREEAGLTQSELAAISNTSQNNITKYEKGQTKSLEGFKSIIEVFGLPTELFTEINIPLLEKYMPEIFETREEIKLAVLLPIVSAEEKLNDSLFSEAYSKLTSFFSFFDSSIGGTNIDEIQDSWNPDYIFNLFASSYQETGSLEALANILPVLICQWGKTKVEILMDGISEETLPKDGDSFLSAFIFFVKSALIETNKSKGLLDSFWSEKRELFYLIQRKLRGKADYIEFSDYYLFLFKLMGIQRDGLNWKQTLQFCMQELIDLCELKNKYAISALKMLSSLSIENRRNITKE